MRTYQEMQQQYWSDCGQSNFAAATARFRVSTGTAVGRPEFRHASDTMTSGGVTSYVPDIALERAQQAADWLKATGSDPFEAALQLQEKLEGSVDFHTTDGFNIRDDEETRLLKGLVIICGALKGQRPWPEGIRL